MEKNLVLYSHITSSHSYEKFRPVATREMKERVGESGQAISAVSRQSWTVASSHLKLSVASLLGGVFETFYLT